MIDFQETITSILAADNDQFYARDPETFFASQIGFCPRQLYVNKLGLVDDRTLRGKYKVANLIRSYFEKKIVTQHPKLETSQSVQIDEGPIRLSGQCALFDPEEGIVYGLKVRNGWYQFSPPVERHIDQLQIYMRGMDVNRGELVYISKNDMGDIREWPNSNMDLEHIKFDKGRYSQLVQKATAVRDQVWTDGIASNPNEIPFDKCGCYFCNEESLKFPDPTSIGDEPCAAQTNLHDSGSRDQTQENKQPAFDMDSGTETDVGWSSVAVDSGNTAKTAQSSREFAITTESEHVPRDLREFEVWVVWDGQSKLALAPWQEGTMYPCEWAASKNVNPRRSFEKARMVADLPLQEIHRAWPFPNGDDLPDRVYPAVLLPHDPPNPPLTFVDFDDVRYPETEIVTTEVSELVDSLGGYAELSRSGTGLHVYVRGKLPTGVNAFTAPLEQRGSIEIYDHSRFTGGTWRHVEGTPRDTVPNAESVIENIVTQYDPVRPQL